MVFNGRAARVRASLAVASTKATKARLPWGGMCWHVACNVPCTKHNGYMGERWAMVLRIVGTDDKAIDSNGLEGKLRAL